MRWKEVELNEFMVKKRKSIDPSKHKTETFELYSIPAYDKGKPSIELGGQIGSSKKVIIENDVLLSRIVPHIRRSWIIKSNSSLRKIGSGEWIVFNSQEIDSSYLSYFFQTGWFNAYFLKNLTGVGGSLMRANIALTGKIKIPLPPLPVQKKIAAILDAADDYRQKTKALIERYDALTQSLFLDMFGDPVKNEKGWEVKKLGDLIIFLTSGARGWAKFYSETGDVFLRINNVGYNQLRTKNIKYVNPPNSKEADRILVQENDILLSITADLGRTAVVPNGFPKAFINQHLALLRPSVNLNPFYAAEFIGSEGGRVILEKSNKGGVKAGLNFTDIKSYQISVPPIKFQNRFAASLKAIEAQKQQAEVSLTKAEDLFQSLLQRAFKGELVK